jgi:hypothetical protein
MTMCRVCQQYESSSHFDEGQLLSVGLQGKGAPNSCTSRNYFENPIRSIIRKQKEKKETDEGHGFRS